MRTIFQRLILTTAIAVVPVMSITPAFAQTKAATTEVPVKQVVLFSSGVGYFEHFGSIQGDSTAGAQGPMQFLPSTFDAYGNGGDIYSDVKRLVRKNGGV